MNTGYNETKDIFWNSKYMTHRLNHMYIQEDKYRMEKEMAERSGSHSREKQNYIDAEAPLGMCV